MTSQNNADFSYMLFEQLISMELIPWCGGPFDNYYFEYSIFIPEVQRHFAETDDLAEYDGIHQLDYDQYVGLGKTLEEAWIDFRSKVELEDFSSTLTRILDEES